MGDRLSGTGLNDKSVGCISDFANLRFAAVRLSAGCYSPKTIVEEQVAADSSVCIYPTHPQKGPKDSVDTRVESEQIFQAKHCVALRVAKHQMPIGGVTSIKG